jgi:microcin C transport system ATP-binding protein
MTLLQVDNLSVNFGSTSVVRGASFTLERGETLALVGESGSGKSVTALSILQLLPYPYASHPTGSIKFEEQELLKALPPRGEGGVGARTDMSPHLDPPPRGGGNSLRVSEPILRAIRGNRVAMVFQEPMTSLNPLHTIEKQISETLFLHKKMNAVQARARTLELLQLVALPNAEQRLGAYPHELSGGQRQRVMIAMALANDPALLIADEPTTALDVTIQAQILKLLKELQQKFGMALLLITHDLGIVRRVADKVCVMQKGEIVESAPVEKLFTRPQHAYTKMLLAAEPKGEVTPLKGDAPEILSVDDLKVHFPIRKGFLRRTVDYVRAVDGVSLKVRAGETVGIVGESGSGKTTLGLALLKLLPSEGRVVFMGRDLSGLTRRAFRPLRKSLQIVFQDPYGSLSPRMSVGDIIAEGMDIHEPSANKVERDERIIEALQTVGLDPTTRHRYPHEFSGGQRQRIAIARAMILKPSLVVLDEPTSALDMSVQAQIVELLRDLQKRFGLAYIFISHDLRVVKALSHYVLVMREGKVVEQAPVHDLFAQPQADYTKALLAAAMG